MGHLLAVLSLSAARADCSFHEQDYIVLQKTLREAERHSTPFAVTARGARCKAALLAVLRNAPLLQRRLRKGGECLLVLHSSPDVFTLTPRGPCEGLNFTRVRMGYGRPELPFADDLYSHRDLHVRPPGGRAREVLVG